MKFNNYLADLSYHKDIGKTNIGIGGIHGLLKEIIKEIKTFKGHGHISFTYKELKVPQRTFHQWRTGHSPTSIVKLYELLELWATICKKSYLDIKHKEEEIYQNIDYFSIRKGKRVKFPIKVDNDFAYFLGYLMGDGFLGGLKTNTNKKRGNPFYTVRFASYNREFAKDCLLPKFERIFNVKGTIFNLNSNCYDCHINSKIISVFLNKICGMPYGKKKGKLHVSKIISDSTNTIKQNFIAGFFDADGYIYVKNKDIAISQGDKGILEEIALLLQSIGIETRKIYTQHKELGITYNLSLRWNSVEKFINTIPFSDINKIKGANILKNALG